jgi:hypothetical protein
MALVTLLISVDHSLVSRLTESKSVDIVSTTSYQNQQENEVKPLSNFSFSCATLRDVPLIR